LVRFSIKDQLKIFIALLYIKFNCCKKIKKTNDVINKEYGTLYKIFKEGKEKIDKDLNIVNVLNRLRFYQVSLLESMQQEDVW